ncbi:hypothetical protein Fmac_007507 [Flemingia macrophylla]|uniref:Uncharacterized protein n=1 Tax=Flemingia macrophylla TaxID=520843 RepID=A0ABD1MUR9_9FABA
MPCGSPPPSALPIIQLLFFFRPFNFLSRSSFSAFLFEWKTLMEKNSKLKHIV